MAEQQQPQQPIDLILCVEVPHRSCYKSIRFNAADTVQAALNIIQQKFDMDNIEEYDLYVSQTGKLCKRDRVLAHYKLKDMADVTFKSRRASLPITKSFQHAEGVAHIEIPLFLSPRKIGGLPATRVGSLPMPVANTSPKRPSLSSASLHSKTRERVLSWSPSALKSLTKTFSGQKIEDKDKDKDKAKNGDESPTLAQEVFVDDFSFDQYTTVEGAVRRIDERYPLPDKYTIDEWNLMTKEGTWLDRSKYILLYMKDNEANFFFRLMHIKIMLEIEGLLVHLKANPSCSIKELKNRIMLLYLPNLLLNKSDNNSTADFASPRGTRPYSSLSFSASPPVLHSPRTPTQNLAVLSSPRSSPLVSPRTPRTSSITSLLSPKTSSTGLLSPRTPSSVPPPTTTSTSLMSTPVVITPPVVSPPPPSSASNSSMSADSVPAVNVEPAEDLSDHVHLVRSQSTTSPPTPATYAHARSLSDCHGKLPDISMTPLSPSKSYTSTENDDESESGSGSGSGVVSLHESEITAYMAKYQHHEVVMFPSKSAAGLKVVGLKLLPERRLTYYHVTRNMKLAFVDCRQDPELPSTTPRGEERGSPISSPPSKPKPVADPIFISIDSHIHGISQLFELDKESTVSKAIAYFLSFYPQATAGERPDDYGLFFVGIGELMREENSSEESEEAREGGEGEGEIEDDDEAGAWLENTKCLSFFPLKHMDRLVLRRINNVFGVDPSTLPLVDDDGLEVPALLALLKDSIIKLGGLSKEGVFRVSGMESSVLLLTYKLSNGTFSPADCEDVYSMGTFIKRFFMRLPQRLLYTLTPEDISNAANNSTKSYEIVLSCIDNALYKALFEWLIRFALDVAMHQDQNRMNSKNLAIVLGPLLIDTEDLQTNQKTIVIVQNIIDQKLKTGAEL